MSIKSGILSVDDDDDMDLQEMFGFRPQKISNVNGDNCKFSSELVNSPINVAVDESIKIRSNDKKNWSGTRTFNDDNGVKFLKLGETSDADIEDVEASLFLQYTTNENACDDEDDLENQVVKSTTDNAVGDQSNYHNENYYDFSDSEGDDEGDSIFVNNKQCSYKY